MRNLTLTIFLDHQIAINDIVKSQILLEKLTYVFGQISLKETTARKPLLEHDLIDRLKNFDWIEFTVAGAQDLDVRLTQRGLSIGFLQKEFDWAIRERPFHEGEFNLAIEFAKSLMEQFKSENALIASGGSAASEFFAEATCTSELTDKLSKIAGTPLAVIDVSGVVAGINIQGRKTDEYEEYLVLRHAESKRPS